MISKRLAGKTNGKMQRFGLISNRFVVTCCSDELACFQSVNESWLFVTRQVNYSNSK